MANPNDVLNIADKIAEAAGWIAKAKTKVLDAQDKLKLAEADLARAPQTSALIQEATAKVADAREELANAEVVLQETIKRHVPGADPAAQQNQQERQAVIQRQGRSLRRSQLAFVVMASAFSR